MAALSSSFHQHRHDPGETATSSNSSSVNLITKKRKPSSVSELDKVYVCSHDGCGKSFMRSDHLARHKLNHEPQQIFHCDRCPRTFVRPDLLKRHAERHDKREQSGLASQPKPGRMKGSTKKKPPVIHDSANDASAPQLSPTSELVAAFSAYDNLQRGGHTSASNSGGEYLESSAPNSAPDSVGSRATPLPSPPIIDDYDHNRYTDLLAPRLQRSPSPESSANLLLDFSHLTDQLSFSNLIERANGSHAMSTFSNMAPSNRDMPPATAGGPPSPPPPPPLPAFNMQPMNHSTSTHSNDHSQMVTGPSNFNAAFDFGTTYAVASSNYDTPFLSASESAWLFNHAALQFDTPMPPSTGTGQSIMNAIPAPPPPPPLPAFAMQQQHLPEQAPSRNQASHRQQQQHSLPVHLSSNDTRSGQAIPNGRTSNGTMPSPRNASFPSNTPSSSSFPSSLSSILNPSQRRNSRHVHFADAANMQEPSRSDPIAAMESSVEVLRPPLTPTLPPNTNGSNGSSHYQSHLSGQISAPKSINISLATRNRLAKHLSGVPNLLSDNRFSAASLDEHLMRFFEWDACHYSAIHRATFEPDNVSNHLLAAMIAIGAYFTGPEAHALAEEIHKCNLQSMLSSPSFCARADIQAIQATLFLNVFGRLMSTYDDHEKAHILYPSFITMYRRSALFNTPNLPAAQDADIQTKWAAWREEETSKRAAFMAYQFDIVCNTMFRQTGTLSAFQIQLTLPCNEDEWYAHSAAEWYKIHQSRPQPPPFLTTMKAFLMPGLNSPELSPLARVVCLHGLLSVAFDMQWREYFLLGLSTHPDGLVKDWRPTLTSAYNCWKTRFDSALTQSPTAFGTQLLRNSIPIYAIAHVTLAVDVDELQIFAGKRRALGLPVPASVVDTTRRRIMTWSGSRGKEAVWHAAHFVRSSLLTRRPYEDATVHPIVLSWCLYLSCLCVHAYSTAASLNQSSKGGASESDAGDAMAYLEAICSSTPEAINLPRMGTAASVCKAVARVLKEDVNWELALEASQLLDKVGT
ncbi:hypothetical protein P389DRAFT_174352 [Cystobasidium minutum MCA 4210]|uniref:uncharacterized protein n=1 Tax=Cystobasidium minutum MCA 4210 TaxID=1397322 RepID=UPI0034CF61D1|eukprot:jgi/Rhomi1/174352/fgenesh1_kg.7_\